MNNFSSSRSVFKRLELQTCKNRGLFGKLLRLIQTKTVCRLYFIFDENARILQYGKKHCGKKEKLLLISSVVLHTHKNKGSFGKGYITYYQLIPSLFPHCLYPHSIPLHNMQRASPVQALNLCPCHTLRQHLVQFLYLTKMKDFFFKAKVSYFEMSSFLEKETVSRQVFHLN